MTTPPDNRFQPPPAQLDDEIRLVLAAYGPSLTPLSTECLDGAGGFSGARLWRLTTSTGLLCLRRWPPEHPTLERLTWIHSVLRAAAANGFPQVPVPLAATNGATWVRHDGTLWELSPWLAGKADYSSHPTPGRLSAAMQALAAFHRSVEGFSRRISAASPGIERRVQQLGRLVNGEFARLAAAVSANSCPQLDDSARRVLEQFPRIAAPTLQSLQLAAKQPVELQPVIRDIWHDHVLFEVDQVSGIVDFGAMQVDSVAGDIARLLGSLVADDAAGWQIGLAAYESIRSLSLREHGLLPTFDRSGVLLGAINWLTWIYLEKRKFSDLRAVRSRLEAAIGRLEDF
jgi:Ser/Thr protein kinase RdoA (MazF antagonist)